MLAKELRWRLIVLTLAEPEVGVLGWWCSSWNLFNFNCSR